MADVTLATIDEDETKAHLEQQRELQDSPVACQFEEERTSTCAKEQVSVEFLDAQK